MHSVTFRSEALLPPLVVTPVEAQRFNSGYPHTSLLPPKLQITEPDLLEHTIYLNRDIKLAGRSFPWPRRGWGKGREKEKGQRRQKSSELRSLFRKAGSPERQAGLGSKALCAARTGASLGASWARRAGALQASSCLHSRRFQFLASLLDITRCAPGEESSRFSTNSGSRIPRSPRRPAPAALKRPPTAGSLIIKSHSWLQIVSSASASDTAVSV